MKIPSLVLLLIELASVKCRDDLIYKKDFQIFNAHDGIQLKPPLIDLPSNLSDSIYHDAAFHGDFFAPSFEESQNVARIKRQDVYSDAYEQFLAENFRFLNPKSKNSMASGSQEENNEENSCTIIYKDGKKCTVCKSQKTNAKAENCSYSSASKPKKFAFKRNRSYRNDESDQDESSDEKEYSHSPENYERIKSDDVESSKIDSADYTDQDTRANPKNDHTTLVTDFSPFAGSIDKVIADFKKKDWSQCRHKRKNGAICYYCKDKSGMKNEECVYTSGESTGSEELPKEEPHTSRSTASRKRISKQNRPSISEGKRIFKRTISMKIHAAENERPIDRKSFRYAKTVSLVEK